MTSQLLITLLTAFGGIILGFLLSQLGDYLRANREDKRILKQVLFNQLDIWVEMKKADFESLLPILLDKFQLGLLKRGAQPTDVNTMFAISWSPLIDLFRSLKLTAPENLKDRYQDSVNQLAKVDPLLAYQLSGRPRTDLNEIIDTFVDRASQLEAQRAQSGSNPDAVTWFSSFMKTHGMKKMLSSMEADIIDVAGAIGYFTKRRTRRRVNELTIRLSEDVEEMVDQFLDSLAEFASQNAMPPASDETRI